MGNHCRFAAFHEGLAMNNIWGFAGGIFFYLAECPVSTVSKILKEEEMRMLLSLLTAKAAPGGLFSNDALLIFNFNFRFLSTFIAWPTERERSNFRFSIQNFRQRETSQHSVNANELCSTAHPGSC